MCPEGWGQQVLVIQLDPGECLVHGSQSARLGASPAAWGRQDRWPLPHPSCRQFCFQPHSHVGYLSRPSPPSNQGRWLRLGWSPCFCIEQWNGCCGFQGRSYPVSPSLHWAQASPATYLACMIIHRSKLQTHPSLTTINVAPAVLCPKPCGDQLCPAAALCLP